MIIDMHTHVVPESFPPAGSRPSAARWPSIDHFEPGRAKVMIAGENFRTIGDQCWSHARRIADLERERVDAQVISPMPELLSYWFTPEDGLDMSRYLNEFIAGLVQAAPERRYGLGTVPLQDPDLAARELTEIKRLGLLGIEIGSNVNGQSLGEPRFLPFFAEAERQGLAVFVHALHPTFTDRIGQMEALVNAVGFPIDTGLTIASLITGLVLERYPGLRLAFSHGGGTFPFGLPRLEHAWSGRWNEGPVPDRSQGGFGSQLRQLLPKSPSTYARMLYYDTLVFDRRAIRFLIEMLGISQLLIGTGCSRGMNG
ncbi:MAG TPA: amidohydrolase family protein [Dehalococcoidia bacterium]|nr:amidohydrolase family protein [Dehalococcoidia bacterium]